MSAEVKRKYRAAVYAKLCTYFGVPRASRKDTDLSTEVMDISGDEFHGFTYQVYVAYVDSIKFEQLIYGSKFVKSEIFDQFLLGEGLADGTNNFMMVLYVRSSKSSEGTLLTVRRGGQYDGLGGIVVTEPTEKLQFTIEPLSNFLTYNYPKNMV